MTPSTTQRYAAIDIGTVTCRMLVADVDARGQIHELAREYRIVNLGEGVDTAGVLKPEAISRTLAAVQDYLSVLSSLQRDANTPIPVCAVATSAARDAQNAADFTAALTACGVDLHILPGTREAELSFAGASCDFTGEALLVVDVGGGSTELVAGVAGTRPVHSHSFNVGCRRASERFLASDPPTESELDAARAWMREELSSFFTELHTMNFTPKRLVAVAGTATTVVSIREHMEVYDSARVHKAQVSRSDLDAVYQQLSSVPLDVRRQIVGLDPARAPVIVAGMLILQSVLDCAGADAFTVSETDILHGIILASRAGRI